MGLGRDLDRLGGLRQPDGERAAFARLALHGDLAPVAVHDGIGSGEAEVRPLLALGREERIEDALAHLDGHSHARVRDVAAHALAVGARAEGEGAPVGHGIGRVVPEGGEDMAELGRVTRHERERSSLCVHLAGDVPRGQPLVPAGANGGGDLGHELVEIHRLEGAGGAEAAEVLEPADRGGAFEHDLLDHAQRPPHQGILGVGKEDLGPGEEAGQRVVEIVRQLARHLAERAHALAQHDPPVGGHELLEAGPDLMEGRLPGLRVVRVHRARLSRHARFRRLSCAASSHRRDSRWPAPGSCGRLR